jgi:uncharacterized protein YggE
MNRTTYPYIILILILSGMLGGCTSSARPPDTLSPNSAGKNHTITVVGFSRLGGQADVDILAFSFWNKDEDATTALLNSKASSESVKAQLIELGIGAGDIENSGSSIQAETIMGADGYPVDRFLYAVNQNFVVTIRNPATTGQIINTVQATIDAPFLYNLSVMSTFSQERRTQLWAEAQQRAVTDANARAQRLATSLNVTLGGPVSVIMLNEQTSPYFGPQEHLMAQISYEIK